MYKRESFNLINYSLSLFDTFLFFMKISIWGILYLSVAILVLFIVSIIIILSFLFLLSVLMGEVLTEDSNNFKEYLFTFSILIPVLIILLSRDVVVSIFKRIKLKEKIDNFIKMFREYPKKEYELLQKKLQLNNPLLGKIIDISFVRTPLAIFNLFIFILIMSHIVSFLIYLILNMKEIIYFIIYYITIGPYVELYNLIIKGELIKDPINILYLILTKKHLIIIILVHIVILFLFVFLIVFFISKLKNRKN
jgi:hypothetical protein